MAKKKTPLKQKAAAEPAQVLERFRKNLVRLRKERGMTQQALADAASVNRTFLGQLETGRKEPSLSTVSKIADALGVSATVLIDGNP